MPSATHFACHRLSKSTYLHYAGPELFRNILIICSHLRPHHRINLAWRACSPARFAVGVKWFRPRRRGFFTKPFHLDRPWVRFYAPRAVTGRGASSACCRMPHHVSAGRGRGRRDRASGRDRAHARGPSGGRARIVPGRHPSTRRRTVLHHDAARSSARPDREEASSIRHAIDSGPHRQTSSHQSRRSQVPAWPVKREPRAAVAEDRSVCQSRPGRRYKLWPEELRTAVLFSSLTLR